MITIDTKNSHECCGCSACEQICPKNCIKMKEDREGFLYPAVEMQTCVQCDLCESVCPILQKPKYSKNENILPEAVGGWHKNEEIRQASSSGGAFTLFAEYILQSKGVVYGCTLNEETKAVHIRVETTEDLKRLRGSKYVQSDMKGVYTDIREQLRKGRKVLFVGTPCQAAGLHSFLKGQPWDNLYLCDFICHGVPSPKVFRSYCDWLETKNQGKITSFKFRNKDVAWSSSGLQMGTRVEYEGGKVQRFAPAYKDAFMNGFLDDLYLRPSCYQCEFKSLPKYYADITFADFWGVSKIDPKLNDGKGTSLLLFHTSKGKELFENVEQNFFYKKVDFKKAIRKNKSLTVSASWNKNRNAFFEEYHSESFEKVQKRHMNAFRWAIHKIMKLGWKSLEHVIRLVMEPVLKVFHVTWSEKKWNTFMQFIKFAMVGVSNSLVSYGFNITALFLLRNFYLSFDYVIANLTGFSLSVLWSFFWNNRYVFALKQGEKRSKKKTLLKTYIVYGVSGIFLNNVLSTVWIHGLGVSRYMAPLLNLPITVPVNFIMNKLWAYKTKGKDKSK